LRKTRREPRATREGVTGPKSGVRRPGGSKGTQGKEGGGEEKKCTKKVDFLKEKKKPSALLKEETTKTEGFWTIIVRER